MLEHLKSYEKRRCDLYIDQGSIVYPIRSELYPEIRCYGVVISASCDIANKKIPYLYYLTALNPRDYLSSYRCLEKAYKSDMKNLVDAASKIQDISGLNIDILLEWEEEDALKAIDSVSDERISKELKNNYLKIRRYKSLENNKDTFKEIVGINSKPIKTYIKEIKNDRIEQLYMLPETSMDTGRSSESGFRYIVELQDVNKLQFRYLELLNENGFNRPAYERLNKKEKEYLKGLFFINNDYIEEDELRVIDKVVSPWREHLLQRFSNGFARIGVDRVPDTYVEKYIKSMIGDKDETVRNI